VNLAKDKLNRAKQDYNSELALNRKLQQDIDNRKAALRRDTEDEKQRLADRVTQYDIDINNVESAIDQNEFKISSIRNSDIPRAEREQSAAENTLASQQSQLDTAKDSLRRSEQDLASFKARTDYDRKEREYLAADKEVQDTRNRMAVLDTQIRSLQLAISRNEAKIVSISSNIEKLISQLASTQTALKDVEAQLVPLNIQKNELTAKLQETQKNLKVNGENYRLNIRDLPLQKSLIPSFPTKFQDWL
jgi:chromosome segregation ATPase